MKKIFVATLFTALVAVAGAQEKKDHAHKPHKKERHQGHHGKAGDHLNLTDTQKQQLKTLKENRKKEIDQLKNSGQTGTQLAESRRAIQEKYKAQMQSVLTPEQRAKMEKMQGEHRHKMQHMPRGQYARGFHAGKMASELNLTEDQKAKLQEYHQQFRTKAGAIKNDNSLTPEQKKAAMKTLAAEQKEKSRQVFTAEQLRKIEAHRKGQKKKNS